MALSFDYSSIKARIIANLSSKEEWTNFLSYGVIDNLISAIAQEMAYEIQYKEYLTNENWWAKAQNRSSLLVESPVHGYILPFKIGATGKLRVSSSKTFNSTYSKDITLPKYFQFSNGTTYFCTQTNNTLASTANYIDIFVTQGQYKQIDYYAVGNSYETITINTNNLENTLYDLRVNDNLWTKVSSLYTESSTSTSYELKMSPDLSYTTIKFGNGIFGKKLSNNDHVIFNYLLTDGVNGNITSIENITTVEDQAYDTDNNPVKLYVTNMASLSGGKDLATIEEIRETSPKIYQAGSRASTITDYEAILSQYSGISKFSVWGIYAYYEDNNVDMGTYIKDRDNVVNIVALDQNYIDLDATAKNSLSYYLYNDYVEPTTILSYIASEIIHVSFTATVQVKNSNYSLNTIKTNVISTLSTNYGIAAMDFNQAIYSSSFISLIDTIEGVRNNTTIATIKKFLTFSSPYICNFQLPIFPINPSTLSIYIKASSEQSYKLLASSDENGKITCVSGYTLSSSKVIPTTGVGLLSITSGLTEVYTDYSLYFEYQTSSGNLVPQNRNQILAYYDSDVTCNYATS